MEDCLAATDFFAGLSWPDRLAIDFNEKSVQGNKTQAARRCKEDSLLWLLMPYHNYKMDRGKARSVRGGSSQHWCDPIGKIERLQEALAKIKHIAQFP